MLIPTRTPTDAQPFDRPTRSAVVESRLPERIRVATIGAGGRCDIIAEAPEAIEPDPYLSNYAGAGPAAIPATGGVARPVLRVVGS